MLDIIVGRVLILTFFKNMIEKDGEQAPLRKALAAKPDDPILSLETHTVEGEK